MIIEELDKEGINLQETILNLENQGYKLVYNLWLEQIYKSAIFKEIREILEASIKRAFASDLAK